MEKVTYIVPIHEFKSETKKLLSRALGSLEAMETGAEDEVIFVGPLDIVQKAVVWYSETVPSSKFKEIGVVPNDGSTDVFTQINKAVNSCSTPYFSVLEFDDAFKPYWNQVAQKYAEETPASVLLPIDEFYTDGQFSSFGNEVVWSSTFAQSENEKVGFVSLDSLDTFMDFNVTGALIKTEDFISLGGLKPSLKIAAWYEFLLRAAYNGKTIFVVPKIGYEHTLGRKGGYSETAFKEISREEGKWLIATAKREYFFKNDRNKIFGDEEETNE